MKARDLTFFKNLLIKQRQDILNKTGVFRTSELTDSDGPGDEGDLAVNELSVTLSIRLQERQRQLLHKIDRALGKIDEGSFGLCEQCEESLNVSRLRARPVASLCIACKEDQEKRERMFA